MNILNKASIQSWIKWAVKTGDELDSGASRVAFKINDKYVLKFAPFSTGLDQSMNEVDFYEHVYNNNPSDIEYFAKIYGYSADYRIIIMEYLDGVHEDNLPQDDYDHISEIANDLGLDDGLQGGYDANGNFKIYDMGLQHNTTWSHMDMEDSYYEVEQEEYEDESDIPYMPSLIEFLKQYFNSVVTGEKYYY